MNTIKNKAKKSIWILCDNGVDIWHLSELRPDRECTTGQKNQREFTSKAKALAEIPEQYRDLES